LSAGKSRGLSSLLCWCVTFHRSLETPIKGKREGVGSGKITSWLQLSN
jgi:hypothetical protein